MGEVDREGPIRRICRIKGFGYLELAAEAGINANYIRNLGAGANRPGREIARKIRDAFPDLVTFEELMLWEPPPKEEERQTG